MTTDQNTEKQAPAPPEGLSSEGKRFAIVASRFNADVVDRLVAGALEAFQSTGTSPDTVRVVRVPGAFELPLAVGCLLDSEDYDGVVALGCVIRGETPHFEYVSRTASDGLAQVALEFGIPVGFGLLTTENVEQAIARAGGGAGNKGFDAAIAAIEMTQLLGDL